MSIIDNIKQVAQDFKSAALNPAEIKDPSRLSKVCQIAKVVAVVVAVMAIAAAIFSGPFGLIAAGLFGVAMFDAFKMAGNIQKIADARAQGKEIPLPSFPEEVTHNISRGTIFAKLIFGLTLKNQEAF
jgi:hypothetical protein